MFKLEPREGLEVFVNENGTVSIKQEVHWDEEAQIIVVHPDDAKWLVNAILKVAEEAKQPDDGDPSS